MLIVWVPVTLHKTRPSEALPVFDSYLACQAAEWQLLNKEYNLLSIKDYNERDRIRLQHIDEHECKRVEISQLR